MWFSVTRDILSDRNFALPATAFPRYQWTTLFTIVGLYAAGCGDLQSQPVHLDTLVAACIWPGMGAALERHVQADPHYIRRILNAKAWPPAGDGAKSDALLGFYPAQPSPLAPPLPGFLSQDAPLCAAWVASHGVQWGAIAVPFVLWTSSAEHGCLTGLAR